MLQTATWVFGVVFAAVGVLGFVPGVTSGGLLLGIFAVDPLHNVIHLVSGAAALWIAWSAMQHARLYFKVFGVVYAAVAVVGLLQGDTVLGLIATNTADHVLHVVLAGALLYVGFAMKDEGPAMVM